MKQKSIWCEDIKPNIKDKLEKDITCNILIIGGGIAGINVALNLENEKDVVLIDKEKIGYGVTSHTTGKLTYLQGKVYTDIQKAYDFNTAKQYLESQKEAIDLALQTIKKYNIECELEKNESYLFTIEETKKLNDERDFLIKAKIKYLDAELPLPIPCKDAFKVEDTYVFHPLKYIMQIKERIKDKIKIYENTMATYMDMKENYFQIKTNNGYIIKAKNVIITTHYPFFLIPGLLPIKLGLNQSYALSAKHKNEKFNAINIDKEVYSVRFYKDNIIVGGFSHDLQDNIDYKKEEDKLLNFYTNYFENKPENVWQTHDLMAHDHLPIISRLSEKYQNVFIATAFNKWGMTNGILAGKILADLVTNKPNKYEKLFQINRPLNLEMAKNFIINNSKITKAFITSKIDKNKEFYNKTYVTNINGISCGVYIDEEGEKHVVKNTCPHFKCSLIFNNADKTWDCPCHGSRFDIDGSLIEGPSVFDIKMEK